MCRYAEVRLREGQSCMLWSIDVVAKYNNCMTKYGAIEKALM